MQHFIDLKCIKLYLQIYFQKREPESKKMRCINIHLTINPFTITFNKYYMLIIVYDCFALSE